MFSGNWTKSMKSKLWLIIGILFLSMLGGRVFAEQTNTLNADVKALMMQIHGKLQGGKHDEADFTNELSQFDELVQKHKGESPDALVQVFQEDSIHARERKQVSRLR
jgi:hypothetical protein